MSAPDIDFAASSRAARPTLLGTLPGTLLAIAAALCWLAACGTPSGDDAESGPTIDVEPALEVPTENDVVEVRRGGGLSGILPGDFPDDVPLVLPASLVDYGEVGGAPYVDLATTKDRRAVRNGLVGLLQDRGWDLVSPAPPGPSDGPEALRFTRDGRTVRVEFRPAESGSVYRIIY